MGACNSHGQKMLSAEKLSHELCDRFLGGEAKDRSLSSVSEIAISESDLVTVQGYINELFEGYQPADFHNLLPRFRWKSIYTTNYDLIVERSYDKCSAKSQILTPIFSDHDRIDSLIKTENHLPYVKLHGCITRISEDHPPLILTIDQYVTHRQKRKLLFERLRQIGTSNTILFVGHSLEDPDIRQILHEIASQTESRPRFYAVMPTFSDFDSRLWESKRVTLIKKTFESLLCELNSQISELEKNFIAPKRSHEIERRFTSNDYHLSQEALDTLQFQLTYIHGSMDVEECKASNFYHGHSKGWGAIQNCFDSPRRISDEIIAQAIISEEHERQTNVELYLISGSAGSGKSIIQKRIAWDSAIEYGKTCLHWSSEDKIDINSIIEITEKLSERIFLFIDRAASNTRDILLLLTRARDKNAPITIFITERTNEWNIECKSLQNHLTDEFEVKYLFPKEIEELLVKLDKHNCLGVLKERTQEERIKAFKETAGRQLLVALHEATMAKPFEEIIYDEYRNVVPEKAKLIYRTICAMNRIGVPVRAGIVSRIHGIGFEEFKEHFFQPLENVVHTSKHISSHDHVYEARHPWIAEMVFSYATKNEEDRFDLYMALLDSIDIGYSSDRTAFRELIKYRSLSSIFGDINKIDKIYDKAYLTCGDDDYFYQQRAIFNMRSNWKRFSKAEEFLSLAEKFGRHNKSISHTWAELELARAQNSTGLEKEKFLEKALKLATPLAGRNSDSSHAYDTLCKVALIKLEEALDKADDELITEATKKAEKAIQEALQKYPDDEIIISEEAKLATLLTQTRRSENALRKAFDANPNNGHIGSSLSNIYLKLGDLEKAKQVLSTLISKNPADKSAHAKMAKLLVEHEPNQKESAEHHWRRSFTNGDTNYVNQLWYARQLYINNKYDEYFEISQTLKQVRLPPKTRNTVRGVLLNTDKSPKIIYGKIKKKESTYILISPFKYPEFHFLHKSNCSEEIWQEFTLGSEIEYQLGFTFAGAAAVVVGKTDFFFKREQSSSSNLNTQT